MLSPTSELRVSFSACVRASRHWNRLFCFFFCFFHACGCRGLLAGLHTPTRLFIGAFPTARLPLRGSSKRVSAARWMGELAKLLALVQALTSYRFLSLSRPSVHAPKAPGLGLQKGDLCGVTCRPWQKNPKCCFCLFCWNQGSWMDCRLRAWLIKLKIIHNLLSFFFLVNWHCECLCTQNNLLLGNTL